MQRGAIYSVQRERESRSYLSSASRIFLPYLPPVSSATARVNVYLCIKQALFIRPMNMHCLVAVARCRVQTRRYHCLINHIQSHRLTLCRPSPLPLFTVLLPAFPVLRSRHPSRREDPPCHPPRALSLIALSLSPSLSSPLAARPTPPPFPSRQPFAIDINLRNFFGASTCHRVTVHPQPGPRARRGRGIRGDAVSRG